MGKLKVVRIGDTFRVDGKIKSDKKWNRRGVPIHENTRLAVAEAQRKRFSDPKERARVSLRMKALWSNPEYREHFLTRIQPKTKSYRIKSGGYYWVYEPSHPDSKTSNPIGYVIEQRIVMEKFLKRKLEKHEIVHHINHDKLDNRVCNLLVTSHSEHAKIHGRRPKNMTNIAPYAKLSPEKVSEMRSLWKNGVSGKELSKRFGITRSYAYDVVNGHRRKGVPI